MSSQKWRKVADWFVCKDKKKLGMSKSGALDWCKKLFFPKRNRLEWIWIWMQKSGEANSLLHSPIFRISEAGGRVLTASYFLEQSVVIGLVGAIGVAHARDYVLQCVFVVFVPE